MADIKFNSMEHSPLYISFLHLSVTTQISVLHSQIIKADYL